MEAGIHFKHWSNKGQALHFYGANGFPTACYQSLLEGLSQDYAVSTLHNRATWPDQPIPKRVKWTLYADDLINFLETQGQGPVIGVGHSLGATATVFAAIKRPDLFSQLVLIEPAMASPLLAKLLPIVPFSLKKNIQPIKYTVDKPELWSSTQAFYDDCRGRNVFKRIDDENLNILAQSSLIAEEQAFTLAFPKLWEAKNYASAPNLYKQLGQLKVPTTAIRGKPSLYFSQESWLQWQKVNPQSLFLEDQRFGHLMPLESPKDCLSLIKKGITKS